MLDPDDRSFTEHYDEINQQAAEDEAYSWTPPVDSSIVDHWDLPDLRPIQEAVNRDISRLVAIQAGFTFGPDLLKKHAPLASREIPAEGQE